MERGQYLPARASQLKLSFDYASEGAADTDKGL
jgi:hypothetical protein